MRNKKISEAIVWGTNAVENALTHAEALALLSTLTYNETKLNQGKAIIQNANTASIKQENEKGEKEEAYNLYANAKDALNEKYVQKIILGRILFKNDKSASYSLELVGSRQEKTSAWFTQVGNFYTNISNNQAWKDIYTNFGISEEVFTAEKSEFEKVQELYQNWNKERGEAENATEERDNAVAEMREWLSDFKTVARIALASKPQLLEVLGIKVESN